MPAIPRDRLRQMLGDGADAAQTARVLVRDEPIGARRAALGQDALQVLEPARDEVVHDAEPTPARTASSWVTAFALSKLVGAPP